MDLWLKDRLHLFLWTGK